MKAIQGITIERTKKKTHPVYEQIRAQLKKVIEDECSDGERLPAVTVLSERLDVTYKTVKSALNMLAEDGLIKFERNRAVVTNSAARQPRDTQTIEMSFVRWCSDAFDIGIYEGINRYVSEHNLQCMMIDAAESVEAYVSAVKHLSDAVDGLIIVPIRKADFVPVIRERIEHGMKVVFVDCVLDEIDVNSVTPDHCFAAYTATRHLLALHNVPVHYTGNINFPSSCRNWIKGWSKAMQEFGHTNSDGFILDTKDYSSHDNIIAVVKEFFAEHKTEEKISILAGNDYIAKDVYTAAEQSGLTIGKNVFVASFSDLPLAKRLPVPLTSIDEKPEQVGYKAAQVLHKTITGQLNHPVHSLIPVHMNIRESSTGKKE